MSDEPTDPGGDGVREVSEREDDLDVETIVEDARELFSTPATERPLQPDAPPPDSQ